MTPSPLRTSRETHEAVHIPARIDYAAQAMLAIAARDGGLVTTMDMAATQHIPASYLPSILTDLRRAGLLKSRTGADGGYRLARPARQISAGDVIQAVSGPLATIRDKPPQMISHHGAAVGLSRFWRSAHVTSSGLLDHTTLDDLLGGA
jgi:Rrf2 family protein